MPGLRTRTGLYWWIIKQTGSEGGEEAVLLDRYRLQLIYYRRALEQITGKTVRQAFLYSLALQKEIPVF